MGPVVEEEPRIAEEDTVELIDYLQVLWTHRWMIVLGTVAAMAAAAVLSGFSPRIYQASLLLKVGTVFAPIKDGGANLVQIEDPKTIAQVLTGDAMIAKLKDFLGLEEVTVGGLKSALMVKVIKNDLDASATSLLELTLKLHDPQQVVDGLNFLADQLIQEHQVQYQAGLSIIDREAEGLKEKIATNQLQQTNVRGKVVERRAEIGSEQQYRKRLDDQVARLERDVTQARARLESVKPDSTDSLWMQNLFQNLQTHLDNTRTEQNRSELWLRKSRTDLYDVENDLALLDDQRADFENRVVQLAAYRTRSENTKVRSAPVVPATPVAPRMVLNVLIAGVVGVMVFVMAAFFREYLHHARRRRLFASNLLP
jgi:capsular polysaccharide biosynthesis protein